MRVLLERLEVLAVDRGSSLWTVGKEGLRASGALRKDGVGGESVWGLSHKRDDAYRLLPGFGLQPRAGPPQREPRNFFSFSPTIQSLLPHLRTMPGKAAS